MKNSFFVVGRALCCAAVLLAVPWLRAEGTNAYSGAKWVFLDVGKVLEQAAGITHANYPDCDEATVDQRLVRSYRADGTGEAQDETFVKVLTEKGKRNNRGLSLYFQLPYNTVEVVKLEVLNPSGQARVVDVAANSKEMINSGQMSMNIYDTNSRIFQVNIPKVEIGDIVHSITRTTTERSIIPGEFAENNVFEGPGYLRHSSYEVYSPADKPLKRIELRDEVPGTVHYSTKPGENRGILHRWEVSYVPRMFDEPSMPPYETVLQRLLVSTTPNWQAVSKWYWEVSKPHLEATTPGLQKTVADLSGAVPGQMEKIKALFYYVSNKIRYMGITPEKDRPGFEPHDVGLTFENKYGVCRDKAALLVSMLRLAGLNAYPVLVSVGSKKDPDVPEPFFNHAIVGVEIKKGDYVLMDPTDENTKDLLPSYECNQSYLLCRPEGDTIRTSPIIPADQNMMRIKTTALLNADGRLQASSDLWFDGINDNDYREIFSRMKPDDIQRFFESNLKRAVPGAKLKSLRVEPENMLDLQAEVRKRGCDLGVAFDGDADRMFIVDEKGDLIDGSTVTALVALSMLKKHPGAKILYNLICSRSVPELVTKAGGIPIRSQVGHSIIKKTMRDEDIVFGGEHSGHFYFKDNWYADSGMIALMCCLEVFSEAQKAVSGVIAPIDTRFRSGEINSTVTDIPGKLAELQAHYKDAQIDHLDGVTISYPDWWMNVRGSNTEPLLRLNVEGDTRALMEQHRDEALALIRA